MPFLVKKPLYVQKICMQKIINIYLMRVCSTVTNPLHAAGNRIPKEVNVFAWETSIRQKKTKYAFKILL